ncbi:exported hypothetical protein [Nostocoides australiense Ben110]|uniref:Uncharacterized protein n=1 Tax=Nostocoides australiense Ben110 TaxID=1193182 RepID=W6JW25_9MICO|nr:exported hypothetical protein [Tetrasphaera australiensis Ben110]
MGVFAPLAHRLAARLGSATPISAGVLAIAVGSALRAYGTHTWPLYAGTLLAGSASPSPGPSCPAWSSTCSRRTGRAWSPARTCSR